MTSVSNIEQNFSVTQVAQSNNYNLPPIPFSDGNVQTYPLDFYLQVVSPDQAQNNYLKAWKNFLFQGLFAKLMFALIGFSFASPSAGRFGKSLYATAGFAFGDLFLKFESWMDKQLTHLIEPSAESKNSDNSLSWSFRHTLVKTLSVLLISIFGAGKKMYALGGHSGSPLDEILKQGLISLSNKLYKNYGVSNAEVKKQIREGDTLQSFQMFSEWIEKVPTSISSNLGVFTPIICKTGALTSRYVLGCPNWYKARVTGVGIKAAIAKDFAMKVGIFTLSGLFIEYAAHAINHFLKQFHRPEA